MQSCAVFLPFSSSHSGFDEDKESQAPCGSFNTANATLTPWYAANGPVEIDSHHETATVQIFVSYESNPTVQTYNQINLTEAMKISGEGACSR